MTEFPTLSIESAQLSERAGNELRSAAEKFAQVEDMITGAAGDLATIATIIGIEARKDGETQLRFIRRISNELVPGLSRRNELAEQSKEEIDTLRGKLTRTRGWWSLTCAMFTIALASLFVWGWGRNKLPPWNPVSDNPASRNTDLIALHDVVGHPGRPQTLPRTAGCEQGSEFHHSTASASSL
jgi:hypothetical protein